MNTVYKKIAILLFYTGLLLGLLNVNSMSQFLYILSFWLLYESCIENFENYTLKMESPTNNQVSVQQLASLNQSLAGPSNSKVLQPPIIPPPSHDLPSWRDHDYINHSQINETTRWEPVQYNNFDNYVNALSIQNLNSSQLYKAEPRTINSNIGITRPERNNTIINHDSMYVEYKDKPSRHNVYDPRLTGYGSSSRSYIDPRTETVKYMYDDVNSVTRPTFLRNNVDIFPLANPRQSADDYFVGSTNTFRSDLQAKLLSKRNAEMWQLRAAPLSGAKI